MSTWITKIRNFIGIGTPELPDYLEVQKPESESESAVPAITIDNGTFTLSPGVTVTLTTIAPSLPSMLPSPVVTPSPKKTKSPKRIPSHKSKHHHK